VCRILSIDYPQNIGSEFRLRSKGTLIPKISFESHVMRITKDEIQLLINDFYYRWNTILIWFPSDGPCIALVQGVQPALY
jgi:hypothetical protein